MRTFQHMLLALAVTAAALTCIGYSRPAWAVGLGLDWWSLEDLEKEMRESSELDTKLQPAVQRTTEQREVAAELIAGRITLLQAAIAFRNISNALAAAGVGPSYNDYFPGDSQGERLCRHVILVTRWELAHYPSSVAESVIADLHEELQRLLRTDGVVHLPED